ncbi:DUF4349 domain-containing protein [Metabacillus sp. 113a]|uniref:DUF4349 domain-containing protein n=1 Tax=Metabacillus sp. 113a TaxID=3404706 RepID=UPI003CF7D9D9
MIKLAAGVLLVIFILTGCSNENNASSRDHSASGDGEMMAAEEKEALNKKSGVKAETEQPAEQEGQQLIKSPQDQKIIYTAEMSIEAEDYNKAYTKIEKDAQAAGGYIVSTSSNKTENGPREGSITLRIPQQEFNGFLAVIENGELKIFSKHVSGQDVTEEFVDLDSRLKAKQAVEERLLSFMEKADKTTDLLSISKDLSTVQEEIEQLKGRKNYLENQTDFSTVTIQLSESKVVVPGVDNKEWNTWEKTQRQFMGSINALLYGGSAFIVFTAGNLPIWIMLFAAGWIVYSFWKRKRRGGRD